jgi:hypothetical protein
MQDSNFNSLPGALPYDAPAYLPLSSDAEKLGVELLLRKGALLEPRLMRDEAKAILKFMNGEHFAPGTLISFQAQSRETGRLMMVLAGEAHIRMRHGSARKNPYSATERVSPWFTATEGSTLGLTHTFSGISSRFIAQASTELFVASISRETLQTMKKQAPVLALRYTEMLMIELSLIALDHERNLQAMTDVARSMQEHIDHESDSTRPAPLF